MVLYGSSLLEALWTLNGDNALRKIRNIFVSLIYCVEVYEDTLCISLPGFCPKLLDRTYTSKATQKNQIYVCIFQKWPCVFVFSKEFQKNTKENMPLETFCPHFSYDGPINLIP